MRSFKTTAKLSITGLTIVIYCLGTQFSYGMQLAPQIGKIHFTRTKHKLNKLIDDFVSQLSSGKTSNFQNIFAELTATLESSSNLLNDSSQFIHLLIDKMNTQTHTKITYSQILDLAKQFSLFDGTEQYGAGYYEALNLLKNCDFNTDGFTHYKMLQKKKKSNEPNVWSWLIVATLTSGVITLAIINPSLLIEGLTIIKIVSESLLKK